MLQDIRFGEEGEEGGRFRSIFVFTDLSKAKNTKKTRKKQENEETKKKRAKHK